MSSSWERQRGPRYEPRYRLGDFFHQHCSGTLWNSAPPPQPLSDNYIGTMKQIRKKKDCMYLLNDYFCVLSTCQVSARPCERHSGHGRKYLEVGYDCM